MGWMDGMLIESRRRRWDLLMLYDCRVIKNERLRMEGNWRDINRGLNWRMDPPPAN